MNEDEPTPIGGAQTNAPEVEPSSEPAQAYDFSNLRGFQALTAAGNADDETYRGELRKELVARADRFVQSVDDSIVLASDGVIRWLGDPIARLVAGDELLKPRAVLLADDALPAEHRDAAERRLTLWIAAHVRKVLGPLEGLASPEGAQESVVELSRKVTEALGVLDRERVRQQVKALDQNARSALRKLGVRFGAHYVFVPALMKPGARALSSQLWSLKHGSEPGADRLLAFAAAGRTSFAAEGALSADSYRIAGFRLCGERVVRVDIVERLTDLIRAAIPDLMRPGASAPSEAAGFAVTHQMTSLTGCAGEAFASILRSLGFESHQVRKSAYDAARRGPEPAKAEPVAPAASEAPAPEESLPPILGASEEVAAESAAPEPEPVEAVEPSAPDRELVEAAEPAAPEPDPVEAAVPAASEPESVEAAEPSAALEAQAEAIEAPSSETTDTAGPSPVEADAAQEGEAPPPPAEDEAMIEVWRPAPRRRQTQHHRPDHRASPPPEGAGRIVWRARDPKEPQRRSGGAPNTKAREKPPEEVGEPAPGAPAELAQPQPEAPRQEPQRSGQHGRGDQRQLFKGPRREERRDDLGPKAGERPPRKEPRPPVVDPDSPFAKLLALRPLLEKRDKRT